MTSWKVKNTNRLLTEIKNKFSGIYTVKDIRWSIDHNRCFVNKKIERFGSTRVHMGDIITIFLEKPPLFQKDSQLILYEDDVLLIYDKPPNLSSEQLGQITQSLLVHRLDRDTSGVMILAKTKESEKHLIDQFRRRKIVKEYVALVEGNPGKEGVISGKMAPLSRREGAIVWKMCSSGLSSETRWFRLSQHGRNSLLRCIPITGRTHQIRVHLSHIGHPIVGDSIYGQRSSKKAPVELSLMGCPRVDVVNRGGHRTYTKGLRPLLHALTIKFKHPMTNNLCIFTAPPPSDFLL